MVAPQWKVCGDISCWHCSHWEGHGAASVLRVPVHEGWGTRHPSPSALCPPHSLSTASSIPGPNARQQEDVLSRTNGLPRCQVPVPSQAAPPQLSICAGSLEGGDGKASSPEAPGQACLSACLRPAPGLWGEERVYGALCSPFTAPQLP